MPSDRDPVSSMLCWNAASCGLFLTIKRWGKESGSDKSLSARQPFKHFEVSQRAPPAQKPVNKQFLISAELDSTPGDEESLKAGGVKILVQLLFPMTTIAVNPVSLNSERLHLASRHGLSLQSKDKPSQRAYKLSTRWQERVNEREQKDDELHRAWWPKPTSSTGTLAMCIAINLY